MRAEEKAARLPAIMTVPLILFILPVLFVFILASGWLVARVNAILKRARPARPAEADAKPAGLAHGALGVGEPFLALGAVLLVTGSRGAVLGAPVRVAVVVEQRRALRIDDEDDVTAVAAVAAVRATERLELLTMHGGDAVPTVAGRHVEDDAVDEVGCHG